MSIGWVSIVPMLIETTGPLPGTHLMPKSWARW